MQTTRQGSEEEDAGHTARLGLGGLILTEKEDQGMLFEDEPGDQFQNLRWVVAGKGMFVEKTQHHGAGKSHEE